MQRLAGNAGAAIESCKDCYPIDIKWICQNYPCLNSIAKTNPPTLCTLKAYGKVVRLSCPNCYRLWLAALRTVVLYSKIHVLNVWNTIFTLNT